MTKGYFNKAERSGAIMLKALTQKAEEIVEELSKAKSTDRQMLGNIKRGITFLNNGLDEWVNTIEDDRNRGRLFLEVARHGVALVPAKDVTKHTQKMIQWDQDIRKQALAENPDYAHDMAEITLQTYCKGCNGTPNLKEGGCRLFNCFSNLLVEPWDTNHPMCPYAQAGIIDEAFTDKLKKKIAEKEGA